MKKLWNKIRLWMIKKLGGYTEQFDIEAHETVNVVRTTYSVKPFVFSKAISLEGLAVCSVEADDLIENIKKDLLLNIGEQLNELKLIEWDVDNCNHHFVDDDTFQTVEVKGKIFVGSKL